MFHPFWTKDRGAVTVDYVVVMAALVGVGVWLVETTNDDLSEHSAAIRGEMQGGMFQTAWDNELAVLPDTDAGEECTGADTCGTGGGGTTGGGGSTGGGTTGGGTTGGGTTGGGTTDPDPDPTPDPDPDPDPTPDPDPDPDPTPDPDPDPTPDPDPDPDPTDPGAGNNDDPFPPPASGQVAGCPSSDFNGQPAILTGANIAGGGASGVTAHSGFTDLRSCNGTPNNRGFFDANPTYSMYLSDMENYASVLFEITATTCDTTLLIRDASGTFHFNDDSNWPSHTRSALDLSDTTNLNGRVDVWIGGYSPGSCTSRLRLRGFN